MKVGDYMKSLRELYKIGNGPSSSHTMGPKKAVRLFEKKHPELDEIKVYLYGSLALTGKGHLTDAVIKNTIKSCKVDVIFDLEMECDVHPNTFDIEGYKNGQIVDKWRVYSIGGGSIKIEGEDGKDSKDVYNLKYYKDIKKYCEEKNISLYQYVLENEEEDFLEFLKRAWGVMKNSVETGLVTEGIIPGKLNLDRRSKLIYENLIENETPDMRRTRILSSYAYAVTENNASGEEIVTAPTCGACGVVPAVLYYSYKDEKFSEEKILEALAVAGIIGNIVKENASISGAECGCQAEVGTACSMAAAARMYLIGGTLEQIENAAEIAMEHHLGLTCDPIYGYVQIPCIERNAVAAMRAVDAANLSKIIPSNRKISFDVVVETMYETGKDLKEHYRETSEGGLAKKYCRNKFYNKEIE